MSGYGYLLAGDESLPFSNSALALCGLKDGDKLDSMTTYGMLLAAESAETAVRMAIAEAQSCE